MQNYSTLQKLLHRIALSSQFMREAAFDAERASQDLEAHDVSGARHVFVAGLARSGTTTLLNALHESAEFASLSYADMPFVLAPNLWSKVSNRVSHAEASERFHGDGIKVTTDSPEAFEEVFWLTYENEPLDCVGYFREFVGLICRKYDKPRYLSKNNQNIRRLDKIAECFPGSLILVPFRDPLQHANSLLTQHLKHIQEQSEDAFIYDYMRWIGHSEFGKSYRPIAQENLSYPDSDQLNHWLEQWIKVYDSVRPFLNDSIKLVNYEALCNDDSVWPRIREASDLSGDYEFAFKASVKDVGYDYEPALLDQAGELYKQLSLDAM